MDFAEIKNGLDDVAARIKANKSRIDQVSALLLQSETDLTSMSTSYAPLIAGVNEAFAAFPNNVAITGAKAEADLLVANFVALKSRATALRAAIDGI